MNFIFIIVAIIILLIIAGFIIQNKMSIKKRTDELIHELTNLAQNNDSTLSGYDTWKNTAIGVDSDNRWLFFIRKDQRGDIRIATDLRDIREIKKDFLERTSGLSGSQDMITENIYLNLQSSVKNKTVLLEFFNHSEDGYSTVQQREYLDKWYGRIETIVKNQ
jgi:type II secretory pathway pseudopilin PulG